MRIDKFYRHFMFPYLMEPKNGFIEGQVMNKRQNIFEAES